MNETITSPNNPRIKELRKLHEHRHRERTGLFLAEGEDMLVEALRQGVDPQEVFFEQGGVAAGLLDSLPEAVSRTPVRGDVLAGASSLGSGTRLIGVWRQPRAELDFSAPAGAREGDAGRGDVVLYLHEVADPANVGAVLRSALALVPSVVVLSPRTADPFGPKAVRASMGAVFGEPIAAATWEQVRAATADRHRAVALVPRAGTRLHDTDLEGPVLLCLGAERFGLPEWISSSCDEVAHVPLRSEGLESLNVAMTATLCLYEIALHRLSRTHD